MAYALPFAAFAVFTLAYYLVASLMRRRRFDAFAKAHGCEEPQDFSGSWLESFRHIIRTIKANASGSDGEDVLDDIIGPGFAAAPTFKTRIVDQSMLYLTVDPANVQAMIATQFHDFETGELRYHQLKPIIGRSIFTSDGKFWEHSRAMFRPQFSRDNINDLESTEKSCRDLIRALGEPDASGWIRQVDVLPLLFNLTLDTATDFLFGESVNSQQAGMPAQCGAAPTPTPSGGVAAEMGVSKTFVQDLEYIGRTIVIRTQIQSAYWLADGFGFRRALKRTVGFAQYFVERALEASQSDKPVSGKKYNLLSELVKQTQDRDELRNQTMAILFAGRDTTASLLSWAFARLALHPDIFDKLRTIILRDFPVGEDITFSKLKSCRYLQHVLNETLRLHPTVPLNYRIAKHDTTLPVGGGPDRKSPIAVPKGASVVFSVYCMQRREDLWGEDVLEFKPERWEQRIPAWQYLPFSGGPRICLGQQFALTEASYVLVKTLQTFDAMEPVNRPDLTRLRKHLGITMYPVNGVNVRMHRAAV
nr:cytochrome p450 52a3-b [Quercus suber]